MAAAPPAPKPGEAVGGLRLVLNVDETDLKEGQPLTGRLRATNTGDRPLTIDLRGDLSVKLVREDGRAARQVLSLPARTGGRSRSDYFVTLEPGGGRQILEFQPSGHPGRMLAGTVGPTLAAWDLDPGAYQFSLVYRKTPADARLEKIQDPWTGAVESNAVAVRVTERPVRARPVRGLVLILDAAIQYGGRDGPQLAGRARLKNVSPKPILVDLGADVELAVRAQDGSAVPGVPVPAALADSDRRARDFVRIEPNESRSVAEFFVVGEAMMLHAPSSAAWTLAAGRYTVAARYACRADRAGVYGHEGHAWLGEAASNPVALVLEQAAPDQPVRLKSCEP
jgi:hypothetical protein